MHPPEEPLPERAARTLEGMRGTHPELHARVAALDAAQIAAVLCDDASVLVRAPVGSGKTRILVHRALCLHHVRGVPLSEMAILTFTNRAADEIRERLLALGGGRTRGQGLRLTGTFHGVALGLLRTLPVERLGYDRDFVVLDDDAGEARIDALIAAHGLRIRRRRRIRRRLRSPEEMASARDDSRRLAALYAADKRAAGAMDFDDLLDHTTELLGSTGSRPVVKAILVDELQDCEPRELAFLRALSGPGTDFFGVGDPHQAIYGWRGSVPEVFSRTQADLQCRVHALSVNYRSTRTIVDGARAVLGLQPEGGGDLRSAREAGERIVIRRHHDPVSEAMYLAERLGVLHAEGLPFREMAILFRLRAQAEVLRDTLLARGIPCEQADAPPADAVRLLTLHAAKGLEFRRVFLSGVNDGLVPLGRRPRPDEDAEERRLLFVGLTRARDGVEIGYHTRPHAAGAAGAPSPYLAWLSASLMSWHDGTPPVPVPAEARPVAEADPACHNDTASPFRPGQAIRHPRYGPGAVLRVAGGVVECDFGKRGARSFPLEMCPITAG